MRDNTPGVQQPAPHDVTDRADLVRRTWQRVNEVATTTEDTRLIRAMISEVGVAPGAHVGTDPADFTPLMVGEWVLGQWADMIDAGSPFLNSARNVSLSQYEKVHGPRTQPAVPGTFTPGQWDAFCDDCAAETLPDEDGAA